MLTPAQPSLAMIIQTMQLGSLIYTPIKEEESPLGLKMFGFGIRLTALTHLRLYITPQQPQVLAYPRLMSLVCPSTKNFQQPA